MCDADAEAVALLLRAAFRQPDAGAIATASGPDLPLTGERIRSWLQAAAGAWVAEVAGHGPVGAVFAVVEPEVAWLAGLGVAPGFRGAGVGADLTDRALEFIADRRRPVTGMEAAQTAVGPTALYARRGYRVADVTVRLRGPNAVLAASAGPEIWPETACTDIEIASRNLAPSTLAGLRALPRSPVAYLLRGPNAVLLCDPDPLIPAPGGSLDLRQVSAEAPSFHVIETCVRAAARSALARGLATLELDLALAEGLLLRRLAQLGLKPIASTIRLVNNPDAYAAWRLRNGPIGRWSF